jgi:hypothetical protein
MVTLWIGSSEGQIELEEEEPTSLEKVQDREQEPDQSRPKTDSSDQTCSHMDHWEVQGEVM